MRIAYFVLLIFTLFIPGISQANSCPDFLSFTLARFEESYFNRRSQPDYFPGWCPNNIFRLLGHLNDSQVDLSQAEVWYIYRRDTDGSLGMIYPRQSRSWAETGWMFHVVLNLEGMVLDMDYGSQPTFEKLGDYFGKMFPEQNGKNENLLVKIVPAQEFLEVYISKYAEYPRSLLSRKTDSIYPPQKLFEAVAKRRLSHPCQP